MNEYTIKKINKVFHDSFIDNLYEFSIEDSFVNKKNFYYKRHRWLSDTKLLIDAPGLSKDEIEFTIEGNNLRLKWETKYDKPRECKIIAPKGTHDIEIEVDNGMIVVDFITQNSDISVTVK